MSTKKSLVEVTHDEGYGDSLLMHINLAFGGKDMRADKIVNPTAPTVQVEGIPDGWELVRVGKAKRGDFYVDYRGECCEYTGTDESQNYVIIRKIEKPKQYRPFANEKEAEPFWDAKLRYKESVKSKEPGKAMFRVNCIGDVDVGIAFSVYSYQSAFGLFECIDGTPFGVEVTE